MSDVLLGAEGLGRRLASDPPRYSLPAPLRRVFRVRATGEAAQLEDDELEDELEQDDDLVEAPLGRIWAFRGLSFALRGGEAVWLAGGRGAGKTTLLRTLAGLVQPSEGSIVLRGTLVALLDENVRLMRADRSLRRNARFLARFFEVGRRDADSALERVLGGMPERITPKTDLGALGKLGIHQFAHELLLQVAPSVVLVDDLLVRSEPHLAARLATRIQELQACGAAVLVAAPEREGLLVPCEGTLVLGEVAPEPAAAPA